MARTDQLWTPQLAAAPLGFEQDAVLLFEGAHKDDDFEFAQLLEQATRARDAGLIERVIIHYATDSNASSNQGHKPYQDREDEAIDTLDRVFNIDKEDMIFGALPDGRLRLAKGQLNPDLLDDVRDAMKLNDVTDVVTLGPGAKDPNYPNHPDHSAGHEAILAVRSRDVNVWGLNPDGDRGEKIIGRRARKLDVMEGYGSQFTVISRENWPEEWGGVLPYGWRLIEGRAMDPYTAGIWRRYGNIILKERYISYPTDL